MKKITNKTTLSKILDKKGAYEILAKHGVPCISCPMASFELEKLEIGQVCKMYGIDSKKLIKDLNCDILTKYEN
jgi:adenine-specific DNA methylase